MTKTVLILGASGRFGRNCAKAFAAAGWAIRTFDRNHDNLIQAAQGVQVIANGFNPPYPLWAAQVKPLHTQVQQAALAADATVIIPGNVYVFGAQTSAPWGPETRHAATNPLGRIRVEMEASYRRAGVKTIILRGGDYLDTTDSGNWFDLVLAKSLAKGRFIYPGQTDIPHAWAFLPDLARAVVALAEKRDSLPRFTDLAFPGFTLTGQELADAISNAMGRAIVLKRFAWWQLQLARPVMPMAKPLLEMRYLWDTPHWLDGTAFQQALPDFAPSPLQKAIRHAIAPMLDTNLQTTHLVDA